MVIDRPEKESDSDMTSIVSERAHPKGWSFVAVLYCCDLLTTTPSVHIPNTIV